MKNKFKIGDKVILIGHKDFSLEVYDRNPLWEKYKISGIVAGTHQSTYGIQVNWDNGCQNYYNTLELKIYDKWEKITI